MLGRAQHLHLGQGVVRSAKEHVEFIIGRTVGLLDVVGAVALVEHAQQQVIRQK